MFYNFTYRTLSGHEFSHKMKYETKEQIKKEYGKFSPVNLEYLKPKIPHGQRGGLMVFYFLTAYIICLKKYFCHTN